MTILIQYWKGRITSNKKWKETSHGASYLALDNFIILKFGQDFSSQSTDKAVPLRVKQRVQAVSSLPISFV